MRQNPALLIAVLITLVCGPNLAAAEWGDLTATILFDGAAPAASPVTITKDAAFCGKHTIVDESLVVNGDNNGIANVIVYMYLKTGADAPPVHESYGATAKEKVKLDNAKCRFEPHVVTLRTTQTLVIGNSDTVGHNCKVDSFSNDPFNTTIPSGAEIEQSMTEAERLPTRVSCSIHPWMTGWLLIKDNPYMGVSDKDGKLTIKNIPAGDWTFQFWQEKAGYVSEVEQDGEAVEWKRGRLDITIKPGVNDLGEIKLAPSLFE